MSEPPAIRYRWISASRGLFVSWLLLASAGPRAAEHCIVLQYHHISDVTPGIMSATPQQFQQHLDHLLINDHEVMRLEDVVTALKVGEPLPDRCVVLTIDDAYLSAYTEAFPRTARYEYPFTVFVSTDAIDAAENGFLRWAQMREMQQAGITFQNHSRSHDHLIRHRDSETDEDWEQRIAADIQYAQNRLETETGSRPALFSYPYGEYNDALKQIVASMGLIAFSQQSGALWPQADFTALPRFAMNGLSARPRVFARKLDSLPLPISGAFPTDPVVAIDDWHPVLTLVFKPDVPDTSELTCYLNGSAEVVYQWLAQPEGAVEIRPAGRLNAGRNRFDCTLPIGSSGRLG